MAESNTESRGVFGHLVAVRPGEWPIVLFSAGYFFFLLSCYFMLRPIREMLGISRSLDDLPWLMTATMVVMLLVNPAFALVVSKMPRRRFIPLVNRFFMANLLAFAAWFAMGHSTAAAYTFYVWLSVFNLFVVSVFWAFMADTHGQNRSRRVYGLVAVGGTAGALAGAALTGLLVKPLKDGGLVEMKPEWILLLSIIPLELGVQCMRQVSRRSELEHEAGAPKPAEPGPGLFAGLALIGKSRYLGAIALYVFVYAVTSTLLYLEQARLMKEAYPDRAAQTAAFANLDMYRQAATLVCQLFLTSTIVRSLGVGITLTALPLVTVGGFVLLWAHPALGVLMWVQVIRHATHHAVDRPTREMLYTAVGADARYKSKTFIDTFIYRGGDVAGTWMPTALKALGLAAAPFAIGAALVWAGIGVWLGMLNAQTKRKGVLEALSTGDARKARGECEKCGYPLGGDSRCPECGTDVSAGSAPAG